MKKISIFVFATLLIFILSFSLVACKDNQEDNDTSEKEPELTYSIAVLSDLQVMASSQVTRTDNTSYIKYAKNQQKMLDISEAILASTVDGLIEKRPDAVLITGDLTESGTKASFNAVKAQLKRLEDMGIEVFVDGGLDDFAEQGNVYTEAEHTSYAECINMSQFAVTMTKYGYSGAISRFDENYSYVTDLPGEDYRLLVLDTISNYNMKYYDSGWNKPNPEVSDRFLEYVENALKDAINDGKEMMVLSYLPINENKDNFFQMSSCNYYLRIDRNDEFEALFTKYGVKAIFTGSMHFIDKVEFSDENGTSTEYRMGSLDMYPSPVFYYNIYDNGKVEAKNEYLNKVNGDYLTDNVSEEARTLITADFFTYSKNYFHDTLINRILVPFDRLNTRNYGVLRFFKIMGFDTKDQRALNLCEEMRTKFKYLLDMKIYGEGDTLESICLSYGKALPYKDGQTTVYDFLAEIMCDLYEGKLDGTSGSYQAVIGRYIIYTGFKFLAETDLWNIMNEIDSGIRACNMNVVADTMFTTDILDLKQEDFILVLISCAKMYIKANLGISNVLNYTTSSSALQAIDSLKKWLPIIFSDEYNKDKDTLWGIKLDEYINVSNGIVYTKKMFDDIIVYTLAKELLFGY